MTYLVPFDGSDLAVAALERATEFASAMDEPVVVLAVVPEGEPEFAAERGWTDEDESYDPVAVADRLRSQVASRRRSPASARRSPRIPATTSTSSATPTTSDGRRGSMRGGPVPSGRTARPGHRTTVTGTGDRRTTDSATLPSRTRVTPERP